MPPKQVKRKLVLKKPTKKVPAPSQPRKAVKPTPKKVIAKKPTSQKKPSIIKQAMPNPIKFIEVPGSYEKVPSISPPGMLEVRKPANIPGESFEQKLKRMATDPEELLVMVMVGDVVGLGLMSQEELDAPGTFNLDGLPIQPSGRDMARGILSSKIRAKAIVDAMPYLRAKKSETATAPGMMNADGTARTFATLYIPDNGRKKS